VADDSQPSDDFRPAVLLTPAACLETIAAKMDGLHEGAAGMLLRAVPVKTGGTGKVYGGFISAALKDPRTNDLIDCRIPGGFSPRPGVEPGGGLRRPAR
jgi:hypothetical protein